MKFFSMVLLAFLAMGLVGCGTSSNTGKTIQRGVEKTAQTNDLSILKGVSVKDLDIKFGDKGLVLLYTKNKNFSFPLSQNSVKNAEIKDGILVFTEETGTGLQTQSINLKVLLSSI